MPLGVDRATSAVQRGSTVHLALFVPRVMSLGWIVRPWVQLCGRVPGSGVLLVCVVSRGMC